MKTYEVVQRYTNVAYARRNQKMVTPIVLGRYQAATIASAINKAAKEWQVPAIVLGASLVKEVVKEQER